MKHMAIDHLEEDIWTAYPRQMDPVQSHIPCVLNRFTTLSEISVDANRLVFASGLKSPRDELEEALKGILKRLDDWKSNLPTCLTPDNPTVSQSLSLQ